MDEDTRIFLRRIPGAKPADRLVRRLTSGMSAARLMRRQRLAIAKSGQSVQVPLFQLRYNLDLRTMHDFTIYELLSRGKLYEPGTSNYLLSEIHAGDTFIDVGANNGYFTLLAASRVGTDGNILSFEPNPLAYSRLVQNVTLNLLRNVRTRMIALSDEQGETTLYDGFLDDGLSSLTPRQHSRQTSIHRVRLDDVAVPGRLTLVKVDVEGHEIQVLEGMRETIRRNPWVRIVLEWNEEYASSQTLRSLKSEFVVSRLAFAKTGGWKLSRVFSLDQLPGLCNLLLEPQNRDRTT